MSKSLFVCFSPFDLEGKHYQTGDGFTPPASWELVVKCGGNYPEDSWNGEKFHDPGSNDGAIVSDPLATGGESETAPTRQPSNIILPVRVNVGGVS